MPLNSVSYMKPIFDRNNNIVNIQNEDNISFGQF